MREQFIYKIFMGLYKAYDAMYQDRCPEILEVCSIGPESLSILHQYWYFIIMLPRSNRCYGDPFKWYRGLTQRDPLSPNLFNVILDVVVRPWLRIMVEDARGTELFYHAVQQLDSFFYMSISLLALTRPEWLQLEFNSLVGLFDRVYLWTNM